jgi:hypothetical protein
MTSFSLGNTQPARTGNGRFLRNPIISGIDWRKVAITPTVPSCLAVGVIAAYSQTVSGTLWACVVAYYLSDKAPMPYSPILLGHVCAGTLGLLSGTAAMFFRKGSPPAMCWREGSLPDPCSSWPSSLLCTLQL